MQGFFFLSKFLLYSFTSAVAQVVKNLPANAGVTDSIPGWGRSPLKKGMAPYSSSLAWEIPWTEEPGGLQSMGHKESDMTEHAHVHA